MFKILRVDSGNQDFKNLVHLLDEELGVIYGISQEKCSIGNETEQPKKAIVVYYQQEAIACGCFDVYDHRSIELRRMFVKMSYRRKGLGLLVVDALEKWAKEEGYAHCMLETGNKQAIAVEFYKKIGYAIIKNYFPYLNSQISICMAKNLC
jgi:putative acetyltransferase